MESVTDPPAATGSPNAGCRSRLLATLNPFTLYDPRSPCAQGTFFWGIVYPIAVAFLIYTGVMVAVFIAAVLLRQEPSTLIDQARFAQGVSSVLAGVRLVLGVLIIIRRTKDLGWSPFVAVLWQMPATASLLPLGPALRWAAGAAQVIILVMLAILPGKIARARKAGPS